MSTDMRPTPESPSTTAPDRQSLRDAIARAYRRSEALCVAALVEDLASRPFDRSAVARMARERVIAVRAQRSHASGVDHLMHEFSLSSPEGVALMCLAEALLRIPDPHTADKLIRDKISQGDWRAHLGHSPSLFVNAATWGLMLTGKLVSTHSETTLGSALTQVIAKGGEPLIRKAVGFAMQLLGQRFVSGETIASALTRSESEVARGYTHSFDMLGEAALTQADANRYFAAYETAIHAIGKASAGRGVAAGPGISVKLSALHPRYVHRQRERVLAELLPRLLMLARLARQYDIGFNIDAEEADRLALSLDLITELIEDADLNGWSGLGVVVQAYQKRCPFVIDYLVHLAREQGRRIMVRLVKGAYWDSEIKRAQVDGLPDYPVYTRKSHTDLAYLVCAARLLDASDVIYPQFATHNAHTLAAVRQMAGEREVDDYEFQCLHGMGEPLYDEVVSDPSFPRPCRIYAPVGSHDSLLPYLVRRLLENGANNSFVNRIVDEQVSVEDLIRDPLQQVVEEGGLPHPRIPLPANLYGSERRNSLGLDLADEHIVRALDDELAVWQRHQWSARPVTGAATGQAEGHPVAVVNPADARDCVGHVREAQPADVEYAVQIASNAAASWHATAAATRAGLLRNAADQLEIHRVELMALCIREAGKTRANAVAEIREAVDFCRYYALQLERCEKLLPAVPPGPLACISPWNFPLSIFIGQLSAALAAGSTVLAKPAEQTSLIATRAVEILHAVGIPAPVLQLLPGRGETVGAALCADRRVRGVIFTGSAEAARHIHRSLAQRMESNEELRLIAETGGQNAMIVDSSALLEQVVQDVLSSAFDSSGQRCSALRVLCVQNEIADRLATLLRDAMRELGIGNSVRLSTDLGPVIDDEALQRLGAHIDVMRRHGFPVFQPPLPADCGAGHFLPPTLIEIDARSIPRDEVFGPVVHMLRYDIQELDALIDTLDATGYGLTFGLHSRVDETVAHVTQRIHAGNIYVNRNMVGAVVGVQPFGGERQSGTGPKAGGPLYLHRLIGTQTLTPKMLDLTVPAAGDQIGPDPLSVFEDHAVQRQWNVAHLCTELRTLSLLDHVISLPGPTGEHNSLHFAPRGRVLCLADSEEALCEQIAAVFATGNTPLLPAGAVSENLIAQLPTVLRQHIDTEGDIASADIAVVLYAGSAQSVIPIRTALAARDGALVPLLLRRAPAPHYALHQLLVERVISVNTAAAGGNALLMTIDD